MSRKELTPDEVERAKRYLATVTLHYHEFTDGGIIISGLPSMFHTVFGATKDDAMNTLIHNVAEVFASIGPVIREDIAKFCEQSDKSTHPSDLAAAIRAMS